MENIKEEFKKDLIDIKEENIYEKYQRIAKRLYDSYQTFKKQLESTAEWKAFNYVKDNIEFINELLKKYNYEIQEGEIVKKTSWTKDEFAAKVFKLICDKDNLTIDQIKLRSSKNKICRKKKYAFARQKMFYIFNKVKNKFNFSLNDIAYHVSHVDNHNDIDHATVLYGIKTISGLLSLKHEKELHKEFLEYFDKLGIKNGELKHE